MISCFLVDITIRSQRKEKECLDFLIFFCLFWKMAKEGSLSLMEGVSFEMTLKVYHTIYNAFNNNKKNWTWIWSTCRTYKELGPYFKWCDGATAAKSECGKFCRSVNQFLQVNYKVWGGKGKKNRGYYKLKEI